MERVLARHAPTVAIDDETLDQIIEGADRFCHGELAPLNARGDQQGCELKQGTVRTPEGFRNAYEIYTEGGWSGLCAKEEDGGQGLPMMTSAILGEMLAGSNIS